MSREDDSRLLWWNGKIVRLDNFRPIRREDVGLVMCAMLQLCRGSFLVIAMPRER